MKPRMIVASATLVAATAFGMSGAVGAGATGSTSPSPRVPSFRSALTTGVLPSPSASADTLSTIQARCSTAVETRLTTLKADVTAIDAASTLTASDKSALLAVANGDTTGLTALEATIKADTSAEQARTDCRKIVDDYRVFVLYGPQVHLVITADRITTFATNLANVELSISGLIAKSNASADKKAAATAALADFTSKVSDAQSAVAGLSSNVLALTPAGYPGNQSTLKSSFQSVMTARNDFQAARGDMATIKQALTGGSGTSPSPSAAPSPSPTV